LTTYIVRFVKNKEICCVRLIRCENDDAARIEAGTFLGWAHEREIWEGQRMLDSIDKPDRRTLWSGAGMRAA
jgi:hypothetical protein